MRADAYVRGAATISRAEQLVGESGRERTSQSCASSSNEGKVTSRSASSMIKTGGRRATNSYCCAMSNDNEVTLAEGRVKIQVVRTVSLALRTNHVTEV